MVVLLPSKASALYSQTTTATSSRIVSYASPPWLSGASLILRPSLARSLRRHHTDVTRRVGDRLFNIME